MDGEDLRFRERAVESASSPETINRIAPIAPARLWLVAAGAAPLWSAAPLDGAGYRYLPGAIVVPYAAAAEPVVAAVARELGLRAEGLKGKLPTGLQPIGRSRVGLYKPWTASIDEGWTRLVLDRFEFTYASLTEIGRAHV
mgnify:CR=1 FL=1